jgi:hypothetical protein
MCAIAYSYVYGGFIVKKVVFMDFSRLIYDLVYIHDYSLCMVVIMNNFKIMRLL